MTLSNQDKSALQISNSSKAIQLIPMAIAILVFLGLVCLYLLEILGLNQLPFTTEKILTSLNWLDIGTGLLIYLKTSIDFALLIGGLMRKYPGFKNRLAIEIGTAVGNFAGTAIILAVWVFFKEVQVLLALMVILASLVLFELANSSLEHVEDEPQTTPNNTPPSIEQRITTILQLILKPILIVIGPVVSRLIPNIKYNQESNNKSFWGLFLASFTIPFILGLDDFAGYVPLFNVVNVFGFGVGVFLGHCILNVLLFLNPDLTIKIIKNKIVGILGCIAFIGLALFGLYEGIKILVEVFAGH